VENDKSTTRAMFKFSLVRYDWLHNVGAWLGAFDGARLRVGVSVGAPVGDGVHSKAGLSLNKSP